MFQVSLDESPNVHDEQGASSDSQHYSFAHEQGLHHGQHSQQAQHAATSASIDQSYAL
jgi:hypothetical protein